MEGTLTEEQIRELRKKQEREKSIRLFSEGSDSDSENESDKESSKIDLRQQITSDQTRHPSNLNQSDLLNDDFVKSIIETIINHFNKKIKSKATIPKIELTNLTQLEDIFNTYFQTSIKIKDKEETANIVDILIGLETISNESLDKISEKKIRDIIEYISSNFEKNIDKAKVERLIKSYRDKILEKLVEFQSTYQLNLLNYKQENISNITNKCEVYKPLLFFRKRKLRRKKILSVFRLISNIISRKEILITYKKDKISEDIKNLSSESSIETIEKIHKQISNFKDLIPSDTEESKSLSKEFKKFYTSLSISEDNASDWCIKGKEFLNFLIQRLWDNYQKINPESTELSQLSKEIDKIFQILGEMFIQNHEISENTINLSSNSYSEELEMVFYFLNQNKPKDFNIEHYCQQIQITIKNSKDLQATTIGYLNAAKEKLEKIRAQIIKPKRNHTSFISKLYEVNENIDKMNKRSEITIKVKPGLFDETFIEKLIINPAFLKITISSEMNLDHKRLLGTILYLYFNKKESNYTFDHIPRNKKINLVLQNKNIKITLSHSITAFQNASNKLFFILQNNLFDKETSKENYSLTINPLFQERMVIDIGITIRELKSKILKTTKKTNFKLRKNIDPLFFQVVDENPDIRSLYEQLKNAKLSPEKKEYIKWKIREKINSFTPSYPNAHGKSWHILAENHAGDNLKEYLEHLKSENQTIVDAHQDTTLFFYEIAKTIEDTKNKYNLSFTGDIDPSNFVVESQDEKNIFHMLELENSQPIGITYSDFYRYYLENQKPNYNYDWDILAEELNKKIEPTIISTNKSESFAFLGICLMCLSPSLLDRYNEFPNKFNNEPNFSNEIRKIFQPIIDSNSFLQNQSELKILFSDLNKPLSERPTLTEAIKVLQNMANQNRTSSKNSSSGLFFNDDDINEDDSNYLPKQLHGKEIPSGL